ncbi:OmpW/AlkL family protein [Bradyrhizobium sp. CCBAU 51627]|uniref:OmpW/AlkL family protein n=1 Tax=Bradyrhizobium sp. CCBAU 51627 TaxID=1325088 RepID=UPI002304ED40|nr:OmpW family outer membrane protein [Bradyrhizobium sp. CCBAU 51627]MDA9436833.1 membrane protein [Bradyrhizobium sp. CCBAU 51627]
MQRMIRNLARLAALGAGFAAAVGAAQAADLPVYTKAPPPVESFNPWMVRLRVLGVLPDAGGSTVNVAGVPTLSSPNSGLSISNQAVPELDISYFFTKNIAAELILGVTRHSISGTGSLASLPIGKTTLLPPTLTLQYHFDNFGAFKPYIGAGVNYTVFFNNSAANVPAVIVGPPVGPVTTTALHVSNAWGGAVQFGFDYMLDRHWGLNVDVKKLWLRPDYTATVSGLPVTGTAHIDPWLVGGGVTYKF